MITNIKLPAIPNPASIKVVILKEKRYNKIGRINFYIVQPLC